MIKKYIPCPACHDIGGGGKIEQWEINKAETYYVCEECDLAWRDLANISWKNAEIFDVLAENDGYTPSNIHLQIQKVSLDLFSISDEQLISLANKVIEIGELIRTGTEQDTYRQLEFPFPIGNFGQRVLIVGTRNSSASYRLAFPSHRKVEEDFHW